MYIIFKEGEERPYFYRDLTEAAKEMGVSTRTLNRNDTYKKGNNTFYRPIMAQKTSNRGGNRKNIDYCLV